MQSSNPVFRRSEGFNGKATASGMTYPAYGSPDAGPDAGAGPGRPLPPGGAGLRRHRPAAPG